VKHIEVINKIIEVEHQAQQLADQALDKREHLEEELRQSVGALRQRYMERAEERVAKIRDQEGSQAAENIKSLSQDHTLEMENMERLYRSHREEWIQTLFDKIIADEEA